MFLRVLGLDCYTNSLRLVYFDKTVDTHTCILCLLLCQRTIRLKWDNENTHLFFSTLKRALASFRLFSLVFRLIQNSTAKSSTNFLFMSLGSLQKSAFSLKLHGHCIHTKGVIHEYNISCSTTRFTIWCNATQWIHWKILFFVRSKRKDAKARNSQFNCTYI